MGVLVEQVVCRYPHIATACQNRLPFNAHPNIIRAKQLAHFGTSPSARLCVERLAPEEPRKLPPKWPIDVPLVLPLIPWAPPPDGPLPHPPQVAAGYIKLDPLTSSDHCYGVLGRSSCAGGGWRVQRELLEVDGTGHGGDGHLWLDEEDDDQLDIEIPQSLESS